MKTQVQTAQSQEKFVIKIDKNLAKIIDSDTRKKLTDAYLKLFSGFSWINWTNKKSLGQSWHNALGQCDGFIKSKNPENPVTKYLKRTYDAHKKYWSKVIMTNQNSQNTLNKPEIEAKQMRAYGIKLIREAMGIINLIYEQFKQYQIEFSVDKNAVKTAEVANTPKAQATAKAQEQTKPQQVKQPAVQIPQAQAAAKAQEQVKPQQVKQPELQAQQAQPVAKVQEQVKPQQVKQPAVQIPQAQAAAKAQEQVKPAIQSQPVAKVAEQAKAQHAPKPVQWQYAQIKLQQQVHAIAKPQQTKQPVAKVPEQVKPQQVKQPEQKITSLKPVQETQIKQQQIKMFMFAKYNQKTA